MNAPGGWRLSARGTLTLGAQRVEAALETGARAVALSGPSGSGKTSLLKALAGLSRLEGGRVEAGGAVWQDDASGAWTPPWKRAVGWAPQEALLFPHLTVRENAAFGARSAADAARAAEAFELGPLLDRRPALLSGGERQRAALARAFARRPRLLLLDEPFSALDDAARARMVEAVRALCAEWSLPLLLVTHSREDAAALAEEHWTILEGRTVKRPA